MYNYFMPGEPRFIYQIHYAEQADVIAGLRVLDEQETKDVLAAISEGRLQPALLTAENVDLIIAKIANAHGIHQSSLGGTRKALETAYRKAKNAS
jgi:hypothetical protein